MRSAIEPQYLDISFTSVGIRNSQKRLEGLIAETAVDPLIEFETELHNNFDLVENIVRHRIASVIAYWCENKHDPVAPRLDDRMGDITNASKNDVTLEEFYLGEVKSAMQSLAVTLSFEVPDDYVPDADALAEALSETGHRPELVTDEDEPEDDYASVDDDAPVSHYAPVIAATPVDEPFSFDTVSSYFDDRPPVSLDEINVKFESAELEKLVVSDEVIEKMEKRVEQERAIVTANQPQVIEVADRPLQDNVLKIGAEEAWHLIYGLIGFQTDYIQDTMLPRWRQNPVSFERDRRFLYELFIDTVRNASGVQHIGGHYTFRDRRMTLDTLWNHYYSDLAQNVAPQLAAARIRNDANDPWYKKSWKQFRARLGNVSIVWLTALGIALVLDALTTYISLDQTPMEGAMVIIFTVLITALFQIADQLVISYRQREFESEAMVAKYYAQYEGLAQEVTKLAISSESYVTLSMNRSKAHAAWQAAEDNRKMARRGRFWTARIADINVAVTAYGFTYLFLNAREPMVAVVEQFEAIFVRNDMKSVDPWVFMMVALAITVSFVVNTAQRTEILGWSLNKLKEEA